jgi:hypothetical protein
MMRHQPALRAFLFLLLLPAAVVAQATFDLQSPACGYAFPIGCGAVGDSEGVSWNGALTLDVPAFGATVSNANALGMPCSGSQFLRLQCANPNFGTVVPPNGPIPESSLVARAWIPIPAGATSVSFCWDFYAAEPANSAYNDAVQIDVVSGCLGTVLANVLYADMWTSSFAAIVDTGPCAVLAYIPANGVRELATPSGNIGPQSVVSAPLPAGAGFLRISAANSLDNAVTGQIVVDSVFFGGVPGSCLLAFTSPLGPGSLVMANNPCAGAGGLTYLSVVTGTAGNFPVGWFFGIDISIQDLLNEFSIGFPFTGTLDGAGASTTPVFGPVAALSGLTLYAVTTHWTPGFVAFVASRPPVVYTIP